MRRRRPEKRHKTENEHVELRSLVDIQYQYTVLVCIDSICARTVHVRGYGTVYVRVRPFLIRRWQPTDGDGTWERTAGFSARLGRSTGPEQGQGQGEKRSDRLCSEVIGGGGAVGTQVGGNKVHRRGAAKRREQSLLLNAFRSRHSQPSRSYPGRRTGSCSENVLLP